MAIPQNRLSTVLLERVWIPPDDRERATFLVDYEFGPIALNDTSQGLFYQPWTLAYNEATDNFVVTPETVGSPVIVLNRPNVTQCTLAFDQNGHVVMGFTEAGVPKLYWYDTLAANHVTTTFDADAIFPTVCLDDKRQTQANSSDVLMFYTRLVGLEYNLYYRQQRERYETARLLKTNTYPYLYKAGMNYGNRVQLALIASLG